ncbi:PepSY domain-containing protein [Microvirga solisilvae]|uniref:PepSY domain-containing protein n=1 Tax=Microvirga solisilvae TaxID=2919498 RepID=UPI001FB0273E|nr:hypothetical protein [Microvirga solisilvae]
MIRRYVIVLFSCLLVSATVTGSWPSVAFAKDGGGDSGGGGGDNSGRGGGDDGGRGDNRGDGRDSDDRNDDGGRGRGRGGDDGESGRGRGRGGDDAQGWSGWGSTSSESARDAVSHGWALGLGVVLPTVSKAVPGQVLEVDLHRTRSGGWQYEFLVLTRDRRYFEVVVDARANRILQIRRR